MNTVSADDEFESLDNGKFDVMDVVHLLEIVMFDVCSYFSFYFLFLSCLIRLFNFQ